MRPNYNLDKIKFAAGKSIFERAVGIYESDGVQNFKENSFGFTAKVRGSGGNFYNVCVSAKNYDEGNCDCYLGQKETLCKHLVAAAIYAVTNGKKLSEEDKELIDTPKCSGLRGELEKDKVKEIKAEITTAMRYIKSYIGPSRMWFAYQNSLAEGCNRLSAIVSELPIGEQTTQLLIDLILRLDHKLCHSGVDDSDGTVGGFIEEVVVMLQEYAELDRSCIKAFAKLIGKETCFDWEEPLVKIFDEQDIN